MSNRKDRMKIRLWRFAEASGEGPLGIVGLLVALSLLLLGVLFGWW